MPVPLAPEVIVIHEALLIAVQLQIDEVAVTPTVPVPAVGVNDWLVADNVNEQLAPAKLMIESPDKLEID